MVNDGLSQMKDESRPETKISLVKELDLNANKNVAPSLCKTGEFECLWRGSTT